MVDFIKILFKSFLKKNPTLLLEGWKNLNYTLILCKNVLQMLIFAISYCFIFLILFCFAPLYAVLICLDTLFCLFCVCFSFFSIKQTAWDIENKLEKNEYSEHLSWIIEEHEIILSFICLLRTEQRIVSCSHISDQPQTVHSVAGYTQQEIIHNFCAQTFLLLPYFSTLIFYVF